MAVETGPEDQAAAAALSERLQSDDSEIVKAAVDECLLHTPLMRASIRSILEPIFGKEWESCESSVEFISDLIARSDAGDARAAIRLTMLPKSVRAFPDLRQHFHEAAQTEAVQAGKSRVLENLFPGL